MGEVLQHLCVSDELYRKPLAALVARARGDAGAPAREWTPTFAGNLLASMLPVPIVRFNLGDVFRIHVVHVRGHLGQRERVVISTS